MDLAVDDVVLTPHGAMRVVEVDYAAATFVTQLGNSGIVAQWRAEDLEEYPAPDLHDQVAMDLWLRCKAKVVPGPRVSTKTIRCESTCACRYCYRVDSHYEALGRVERTHMIDSALCLCLTGGPNKLQTKWVPCECIPPDGP